MSRTHRYDPANDRVAQPAMLFPTPWRNRTLCGKSVQSNMHTLIIYQVHRGDGMAQRGERLVILLKVSMYTPIFTTRRRSWVRVPLPQPCTLTAMNLVMCSGNAPFDVVAAGSLRCDWFSLVFPIGVLQGFSSIAGAYSVSLDLI